MNNEFLEELAHEPIANTFKLAYKMLLSNKFLFAVVTIIFIFFSIIQFVIPLTFARELAEISMVFMIFVIGFISIISQVFTESNYLYICKMVLESQSEEECVGTMASTKVSEVFTNYFVRALGSSFAIVLIVTPFILIRKELYMGEYLDVFLVFLMLFLLFALYIYPIVVYKITQSKNFKESFVATFSLFSPSVWKQSLNLGYAKFVIFISIILSGMYYLLIYLIETIENTSMTIPAMVIMTVLSIFVALYVLPITMMIAQSLTEKSKRR